MKPGKLELWKLLRLFRARERIRRILEEIVGGAS